MSETASELHQNNDVPWRGCYRCARCQKYFNVWTDTPLHRSHRRPSEILRIMKALVEGKSTRQLARELGRDCGKLARFERRLHKLVFQLFGPPRKDRRRKKHATCLRCALSKTKRSQSLPTLRHQFGKRGLKGIDTRHSERMMQVNLRKSKGRLNHFAQFPPGVHPCANHLSSDWSSRNWKNAIC
jgi:hypothetical protein